MNNEELIQDVLAEMDTDTASAIMNDNLWKEFNKRIRCTIGGKWEAIQEAEYNAEDNQSEPDYCPNCDVFLDAYTRECYNCGIQFETGKPRPAMPPMYDPKIIELFN